MSDELQILIDFEKDTKYLKVHFREYQEKYGNQYVAIFKEKLISVNKDLKQLIEEIKKQNIDPSFVLIEYIPKAGIIILY